MATLISLFLSLANAVYTLFTDVALTLAYALMSFLLICLLHVITGGRVDNYLRDFSREYLSRQEWELLIVISVAIGSGFGATAR